MPRFIRFGSLPIGGLSFVCILLFTFCPPLMAQKAEQLLGNAEQQPNESDALEAWHSENFEISVSRTMQREALEIQLDRWGKAYDLNEKTIEKINASLEGELRKLTPSIPIIMEGPSYLNRDLRSIAFKKLRAELSVDDQAKLDLEIAEQEKIDQRMDVVSQLAVTSYLDERLCFTAGQLEQVKAILAENWNYLWNEDVSAISTNGVQFGYEPIKLLRQKIVKKENFFSEKQEAVLHSGECFEPGIQDMAMRHISGAANWDRKKFKARCDQLVDLKVEELQLLFELDQEQQELLSTGRTDAILNIVDRRKLLIESFKDGGPDDSELLSSGLEPLSSQVTREVSWREALDKILSEDELEIIDSREAERLKNAKIVMVESWVGFILPHISSPSQFTYEQHVALTELLLEELELRNSGDLLDSIQGIYKISDEKYKAILNESQWKVLEAVIESGPMN